MVLQDGHIQILGRDAIESSNAMCVLQALQLQAQVSEIEGFFVIFLRLDFMIRNSVTANVKVTEAKIIIEKTVIIFIMAFYHKRQQEWFRFCRKRQLMTMKAAL